MHALSTRLLGTIALTLTAAAFASSGAFAADNSAMSGGNAASNSGPATANMSAGMDTGESASNPKMAQKARMKSCNADAKMNGLKGDERKAFMKTCLSTPK